MMLPDHTKPRNNSTIAVEQLRDLIFSGALAAGSNHLETELAKRLNMSRTPVREAALTLEAQGLVAVQARKGIKILPISVRDMEEIYDVLTVLESMAARQAAELAYCREDLEALAQTIADMETALGQNDRDRWAIADDNFHTELVRLGGNRRVMSTVAMMADQVRRAKAVTLYLRPLPSQSNEAHRAVLDAIANGDAARAERVHRLHRVEAKETLIALLTQSRLQML